MKKLGLATTVAALVGVLAALLIGVPAYSEEAVTCSSGFGTKIPVLMVHGFNSRPTMWKDGAPSISTVLQHLPGIYVEKAYDYEKYNLNWVTDPAIGKKLALTIHCLARNSRQGGGTGKVILVTHSMGGLAAREAASWAFDGRKISDEIGLVITLGAPHTGSVLANAGVSVVTSLCQAVVGSLTFNPLFGMLVTSDQCTASTALNGLAKGSKELQQLAPFPASLPVRAIGGNVTLQTPLFFTQLTMPTNSDLVVGTDSATAEYTTTTANGGGRFVVACTQLVQFTGGISGGDCWHNQMYQTAPTQQLVVESITKYLAATKPPATPTKSPTSSPARASATPTPTTSSQAFALSADSSRLTNGTLTLFNRLTIHPSSSWSGQAGEPASFVTFSDTAKCPGTAGCSDIMFVDLANPANTSPFAANPLQSWPLTQPSVCHGTNHVDGPIPASIGGTTARLYRQHCDGNPPYDGDRYAWVAPGKLFVMIEGGGSAETLQAALQTAVWRTS